MLQIETKGFHQGKPQYSTSYVSWYIGHKDQADITGASDQVPKVNGTGHIITETPLASQQMIGLQYPQDELAIGQWFNAPDRGQPDGVVDVKKLCGSAAAAIRSRIPP